MTMASMKYTDEELNYFRVCKVTTTIITDGLRTVFKQEWDTLYKATHGQWQDTAKNGNDFIGLETPKSQRRNAKLLATVKNGNTDEWDCTCLFFAILYSDSIGRRLNTTVKNRVDELREFRNEVFAHTTDGKLTEAYFKASITKVTTAITALKLDTTVIEEIKNQTSFTTKELEDIKKQLEKEKKRNEEPRLFCVLPPKPSHETIDRLNEVEKIEKEMERLRNSKKNEITVVYLSGNPGCGKSEVARQVGERFFDDKSTELNFVMTLNASSVDTLLQSYVEFAGRVRCDEDSITRIATSKDLSNKEKLKDIKSLILPRLHGYSSWLMIADNVLDLKSVSNYWPQAGEKTNGVGQMLVTTQDSSSIPSDPYTHHSSLSRGMNRDDAMSTLSQVSGFSAADEDILFKVANALDFQPLALACAAVYMQRIKSKDWTKYLEKIKQGKRENTETVYKKTSSTYPATMTEAVRLAVEKEANEDKVMMHAFQFLSVIAPEPILLTHVVQYVRKYLPDEDEDLIAATVCSSSLVLSSEEDESKEVCVHQVVHSCLQTHFLNDESKVKFDVIWEVILAFPTIKFVNLEDDNDFDTTRLLLPHFTFVISKIHHCMENSRDAMADSIHERGIDMIEYLSTIKSIFHAHGRCDNSKTLLEILSPIVEGIGDKKHPSFAVALNEIADNLRSLGRYDEAMQHSERALAIQESENDKNHVAIINTLTSLSGILCEIQRNKEAKGYVDRALVIQETFHDEKPTLRAFILSIQGGVFQSSGQHEQAKECYEKALIILEMSKHGKLINLFFCHVQSKMGSVLRLLGELQESKQILQKALAIFEEHAADFYDKHVLLVNLLKNLGDTLRDLGKFEEAIKYFERALAIRISTSGFVHPRETDILDDLASCLTSLGKHKEAKDYLDRALERLNDENHDPQLALSLRDIGIRYTGLKQYQRAITCFERELTIERKLHGEEHSESALTLYFLGVSYLELKEYQQAIKSLEEALKCMEKSAHGEQHLLMLDTLSSLGVSYFELKEYQQAIKSLEEALNCMEKSTHGEQHPRMVDTLYYLGASYLELKEYQQAIKSLEEALKCMEKSTHGEQYPLMVDTLSFLGVSYFELKECQQAIKSLEEALNCMEKSTHDEQHPLMVDTLYFLGISYFILHEFEQAKKSLEEALKCMEKSTHGEQHRRMVNTLYYLGASNLELTD